MLGRFVLFIAINFLALLLGGLFTDTGVTSTWYQYLEKAPWTPPGWVFGAAWTSIMICLAIYMSRAWAVVEMRTRLLVFFLVQWVLNVAWNPLFFYAHQTGWALLEITCLMLLLVIWIGTPFKFMKGFRWLLLPYVLWLVIATSLNAYIWMYND